MSSDEEISDSTPLDFVTHSTKYIDKESIDESIDSQATFDSIDADQSVDISSLPNCYEISNQFFNQQPITSSDDEIEEPTHDDFFKQEFLRFRIIEKLENDFELWDNNSTNVFVGEQIPSETQGQYFTGRVKIIASTKTFSEDALGKEVAIWDPFFSFCYEKNTAIIAPLISFAL